MSRIQIGIRSAKKAQNKNKISASSTVSSVTKGKGESRQLDLDLEPGRFATLDPDQLESNRIIHENFAPDAITPYKILRTRVLQTMDKNQWHILAVTAAHEGAGKTNIAINLAITMARSSGRSIYLLDLDLHKPGIAVSLGIAGVKHGLGEYLSGDATLNEILWDVGVDHLVVIPGTARFNNSSELLTSAPMRDLITAIQSDPAEPIVIVDLPPVLVTDDALAIVPMIDCLLFVVAEGETNRADLLDSIELLKDVELAGVVLNKSRDPHPGY